MTSSYVAVGYDHAHNVNVSYNIFENVTATWGAVHLHGTASGPSYHEADGGYIGYNTISGAVGDGIWTVGNDDVTIEYNHILGGSGTAIQALNHVGTNILIHGNTIKNSGAKGINYWADDGGVITGNIITDATYEAIFTDAQAVISGNQISGGGGYGIQIYWGAAGSVVSDNTIMNPAYEGINAIEQVTISGNDISGGYNGIQIWASGTVVDGNNIHDNDYWGLSIQNSVNDATVENNQLTNNPYCGVTVWGDGQGSGIHINYNNISGNGIYGVESFRTESDVDAQKNWWGHASGPSGDYGRTNNKGKVIGKGDAVSANVAWDPWLPQPVGHTKHDPVPPGLN
jgi:parallel beta-helix repeat protein